GTHAFRRVLHQHNLKPLTSFAALESDEAAQRSILIVYGDPRRSLPTRGGDWLQRFLTRGGAMLYASDLVAPPPVARELAQLTGCAIADKRFRNLDPQRNCFRENQFCPWIVPTASDPGDLFRYRPRPIVTLKVASNLPARLERQADADAKATVQPLARL